MATRRVVTGKNANGRSVVISDGTSPREFFHKHWPGFVTTPLWTIGGTPDLARDPRMDPMATGGSLLPAPGGSTFIMVTFPPDSIVMSSDFRPDLAAKETMEAAPGISETFEPDHPGMHTTPTVDYGIVLSGEITVELDDGVMTTLRPGDTIVQQGARHAWRNLLPGPATVAFVLLGANNTP